MKNEMFKILIVDDNEETIEVFVNILRRESYDVSFALSGEEALSLIENNEYDLILLDVKMPPGMSGFDVCRHLQKNEKTRKIPVIFISVSGDADDIVKGFTSGCRDYVTKDSSSQEILARIKTQLSLKQKDAELREKNSELKKKQQEIKQKNLEIREKNLELIQKNNELRESLEETNNREKEIKKILYNILPSEVVEELKNHGEVKPYHYKKTSVLFTDFKNFSLEIKDLTPGELITRLDEYFSAIDRIIEKWKLEKIKTIGDSYMCAGGLPRLNKSNPIQAVLAGLEIQRFIKDKNEQNEANNKEPWEMRIGIHTGDVIAGVLGGSKYSYDIWGDTVNIASRMESEGEVGKVNISGVTYEDIKDYFQCTPRNKIKTRHIGEVDMYFVERIRPEYSEDDTGLEPNERFLKIIENLFHSKEI